MPTLAVQIINNATPQVTVEVADAGAPPVTYAQVKQSLGTQVYKVENLYIYSQNINQLLGVIQYQIFDSTGDQNYSSIATTIDPFSGNSVAIDLNLKDYNQDFILNGNSSFSTEILPLTYLQIKFYSKRITNEFGGNLENFRQMEIDASKPNFYNNYGAPIAEIQETNKEIENNVEIPTSQLIPPHEKSSPTIKVPEDCTHLIWLGIAAISVGVYMAKKKD